VGFLVKAWLRDVGYQRESLSAKQDRTAQDETAWEEARENTPYFTGLCHDRLPNINSGNVLGFLGFSRLVVREAEYYRPLKQTYKCFLRSTVLSFPYIPGCCVQNFVIMTSLHALIDLIEKNGKNVTALKDKGYWQ
jgi:hypothetical protein